MTPFSYSRLNSFELCPKRFFACSIQKSFKEPETPAMNDGKAVHKALELRVGKAKPLPAYLGHLEPLAGALANSPGRKLCEFQMAINEQLAPTSWFAKDVYCRAVADLAIVNGTIAAMFDYKTGKKSDDFLQLKLTATLLFQHEPEVNKIRAAFVWTQDRTSSPVDITRPETADVWSELAPRIARFQKAFVDNDFPPRPGWPCKKCPVRTCPYWEGK